LTESIRYKQNLRFWHRCNLFRLLVPESDGNTMFRNYGY